MLTPADFRRIFTPDDLFGFSAEGLSVVTRAVESRDGTVPDEPEDGPGTREPTIWLDTGE
jgi:hypothetical protein